MKRNYFFLLTAILALVLSGASRVWAAPASRPNIVILLLDNIGQEWFGSYGSEEGVTPNIDRLAANSVRFSNCYTTTVCGPN